MTYSIRTGETITDAVLNATGDLSNWKAVLDANGFSDWTPVLPPGEPVIIPDEFNINTDVLGQLSKYPSCNFSVSDVYGKIDAVFTIIAGAGSATAPKIAPPVQDTNTYYTVRTGESITDVVLNSTGALLNWQSILDANGFSDWVPALPAGQKITIPASVTLDINAWRQLQKYPSNNHSVNDVYDKINVIFDIFNNNWILATGFWNDNAIWIDSAGWIDSL